MNEAAAAADGGGLSAAASRVPSPVDPPLPASTHVGKIYAEKAGGGFAKAEGGGSASRRSIKLSR